MGSQERAKEPPLRKRQCRFSWLKQRGDYVTFKFQPLPAPTVTGRGIGVFGRGGPNGGQGVFGRTASESSGIYGKSTNTRIRTDDVPTCPVEVRGGEVWVRVEFGHREPAAYGRQRLHEGMAHNLGLVIAKALQGQLAAGVGPLDIVRQAAVFGARNREGWGTGMTILTGPGQPPGYPAEGRDLLGVVPWCPSNRGRL
jgi:hypothetical protein